jgi:hypothetical protein
MDNENLTKEEIALELALAFLAKTQPMNTDHSAEGEGKSLATFYNAILENLKV